MSTANLSTMKRMDPKRKRGNGEAHQTLLLFFRSRSSTPATSEKRCKFTFRVTSKLRCAENLLNPHCFQEETAISCANFSHQRQQSNRDTYTCILTYKCLPGK